MKPWIWLFAATFVWTGIDTPQAAVVAQKAPDVVYVPTPQLRVDAMLEMAKVTAEDVVYDLGCGDGRIPITAARDYGARAVCIDIDPARIAEAQANVRRAGVEDKVEVRQADLFEVDLSEATVITLYLLPSLNERLKPKLQAMPSGTRVVSHSFDMGTWAPDEERDVEGDSVYLWRIR